MTEAAMAHQLQVLTTAVLALVNQAGKRLTRAEMCERLHIHRNTLATWLETDRHFPRPDKTGKWLLADVVAWELSKVKTQ